MGKSSPAQRITRRITQVQSELLHQRITRENQHLAQNCKLMLMQWRNSDDLRTPLFRSETETETGTLFSSLASQTCYFLKADRTREGTSFIVRKIARKKRNKKKKINRNIQATRSIFAKLIFFCSSLQLSKSEFALNEKIYHILSLSLSLSLSHTHKHTVAV